MNECSNYWQPISLLSGSCWWVYFTWQQLFLLLILLFLALAGGFISLDAGTYWAFILLFLALVGGFISMGCWQLPDLGGYSFYGTG